MDERCVLRRGDSLRRLEMGDEEQGEELAPVTDTDEHRLIDDTDERSDGVRVESRRVAWCEKCTGCVGDICGDLRDYCVKVGLYLSVALPVALLFDFTERLSTPVRVIVLLCAFPLIFFCFINNIMLLDANQRHRSYQQQQRR